MKRQKSHPSCIFVEYLHQHEIQYLKSQDKKNTHVSLSEHFNTYIFYMTIQSVQTLHIYIYIYKYTNILVSYFSYCLGNMVSSLFLRQKRMPDQLVASMALWWPLISRFCLSSPSLAAHAALKTLPTKMRRLVLREANVDTGFLLTKNNLWEKTSGGLVGRGHPG